MSVQVGEIIGDYQVVSLLGRGGMGSVFKVRNVISDRFEAMKVLLPDLSGAPDLAERFTREIKTLASLQHPNIASLHTALRHENQLLMVMEFAEGSSLEQLLSSRAVHLWEGVGYLRHVLDALGYAHSRGVIHRDIKPANIMAAPGGVVKLLDFGIASSAGRTRLTQSGEVIGSAYYISPEQIRTGTTDHRSDLYAVGVTLYELATGRRPFIGDNAYTILCAHLEQQPLAASDANPMVPPLLSGIIDRSLDKNPGRRFQSAAEFGAALGVFEGGKAPGAAVPSIEPAVPTRTPIPEPLSRTHIPAGAAPPEALEKLKKDLAAFIGPMARVLVARAAKGGTSLEQMYTSLALEIASDKDRARFLASRPRAGT